MCSEDVLKNAEKRETSTEKCQISVFDNLLSADANRCFSVNRIEFIKAKQADLSLADCFSSVASTSTCPSVDSGTCLQNSECLKNLQRHLKHLGLARKDIYDTDVGNHSPIKQHAYHVNLTKRALLQQEVSYLLENGLAVPRSSAWSSPCLLVPKVDKTLPSVTKADSYQNL